jgi:hypothetical protein
MRVLLILAAFSSIGRITLCAAPFTVDLSGYHSTAQLRARVDHDALVVEWTGESNRKLQASFGLENGTPVIRELSVRASEGGWSILGRGLTPCFEITTGIRRTNHGLPDDKRWDVFWDVPLNHTNDIRRFIASYRADRCAVRTEGARIEISFPGLAMGIFSGRLQFTVYGGANLLRVEAIATTEEPSVAYKYEGGLTGFSTELLPRIAWQHPDGASETTDLTGAEAGNQVVVRTSHRLAIAEGSHGAIGVFPPPHQFFFARELEVNLGYLWYRRGSGQSFSMGVRHADHEEGYNPAWIQGVFALYNAPPRTWQHMPVYFYLSAMGAGVCRNSILAYTHGDQYQPLPGYKTMVTHFHLAFTKELMDSGSLDTVPPWIPMMRALGINIAHIFDFHGDGHPNDPGPLRLTELENYFASCRRHSDADFLVLPGEEANVYLGGHYNIVFPRPVYWTHVRTNSQPLVEELLRYGKVYHTSSASDLFQLIQQENALVWQTHPRTKGSTGYPDKIRDAYYLQSDHWLGAAFKALPVDLSQKRLGEVRCFGTLDDLNNWGQPKYMVGEVDTYKEFPDYDLYSDFNVNYVKLDRLPDFDDWSAILNALRRGEFFVTTGEVLIPHWLVESSGGTSQITADIQWTFPLEFAEVVWGDGQTVIRKEVPMTQELPFGSTRVRIPFDGAGKKWVRFAVWDSAGNGAFTQPVHLNLNH